MFMSPDALIKTTFERTKATVNYTIFVLRCIKNYLSIQSRNSYTSIWFPLVPHLYSDDAYMNSIASSLKDYNTLNPYLRNRNHQPNTT
jgi:hypothetical protein